MKKGLPVIFDVPGINPREVIERLRPAVCFTPFYPGSGLGGYCVPQIPIRCPMGRSSRPSPHVCQVFYVTIKQGKDVVIVRQFSFFADLN